MEILRLNWTIHHSTAYVCRPPFPPPPSSSLPQLSQWEVDWYSLTDVILSVTLNVESICFVRAGLVNIYTSFRARQLAPYYLLPAPNGNVNDVLQIKRSLCKQWPYLMFFTVDCAFCAMSFIYSWHAGRAVIRAAISTEANNKWSHC